MVRFVDDHRKLYGVEPICRVLKVAPSWYYALKARERDENRLPARVVSDRALEPEIERVWVTNRRVYGSRKIWLELCREGHKVARCTVTRLMRASGMRGVVRGRRVRTTVPEEGAACPQDLVQRNFTACRPNQLWVSDFTYVSTRSGFMFTSFVIDVFSRRIVGWNVSSSMKAELTLDALGQALGEREIDSGLIHHSDRGVQYLAVRYTKRLQDAGIEPSVGSRGDSYDNALAETIIGLYKTQLIRHSGPWRGMGDLELSTLEWVSWYNGRRLMESLGYLPPAEYERQFQENNANTESAVLVLKQTGLL